MFHHFLLVLRYYYLTANCQIALYIIPQFYINWQKNNYLWNLYKFMYLYVISQKRKPTLRGDFLLFLLDFPIFALLILFLRFLYFQIPICFFWLIVLFWYFYLVFHLVYLLQVYLLPFLWCGVLMVLLRILR